MGSRAGRVRRALAGRSTGIKLRLDVILLVLCALIFVVLAYERKAIQSAQRPSYYSTYDTGRNGYRALYDVLVAAGIPLTRFEQPLELLAGSARTLVITAYENEPSANPLSSQDASLLRRFVTGGGRLIAIDSAFDGPLDVAPGVGTSLQTPGGRDGVAMAHNAYTAGVTGVRGPIDWTFAFKDARGIPLIANGQGVVAMAYRVGRGEVIAITAPALFGNRELRNADNLRLAYDAIGGHGPVAFDEYVHGYSDALSLWGVLPGPVRAAVWIVVALALIALIGANVPFAPPYLPDAPDERDSSHYITALAELMRRSRRRAPDDDVVWRAAMDFHRRKEHA